MEMIKLSEVLDVKRGASLSGECYATEGDKIRLTLGNFNYPNGGFKEDTSKEDIYFTGFVKPEFILKKGDIITPLTEQVYGLLGETATIPADNTYIQSGDVGLIIVKPKKLYNRYAYYLLPSPIIRKQLGAGAQQTKIRHTSPDKIKDCLAIIPKMDYQRKVADLLDLLNNKISTNNAIISELESMAKVLYDRWFLQFDFPDENGNPYKFSGGKMVWNEKLKREIPEGWEVNNLQSCIDIIRGVAYSPDDVSDVEIEGYVPLVKSNNLQDDKLILDKIIYVRKELVESEQYLTNNSIFITMSSGSAEHVGKTATIYYDMPYCYGAFCSKIEIVPKYKCFVSQFFLSNYFKKKIRTIIVGTSIKNISTDHLINNYLPFPPDNVLSKFERLLRPMFDKQGEIVKENLELVSLRDFLLPILMNEQVSFKDKQGA